MSPLFSAEGRAALATLASRPALYAFDFDGTLAPIVPRPDDAKASEATLARLSVLGSGVPIAIVTGRSVADIRQRMEFTPRHLIGNHGAEGLPHALDASLAHALTGSKGRDEHREVASGWTAQWPAAIAAVGEHAGIVVEDKTYSLSIHHRLAQDQAAAGRAIEAAIARLRPLPRVIGGKLVFNLMPEGAADKGQALEALVRFERCDAAFFIGDDTTDELAFAIADPSWVTVRVGNVPESSARFYVEDQSDIDRCLDLLIEVTRTRG